MFALASLVSVSAGPGAMAEDDETIESPGVYTEEEPSDKGAAFTVAESVGLFVGSGTAKQTQAFGTPIDVSSMSDFEARVETPSTELTTALEHYFGTTKSPAQVLLAPSPQAPALTSAVASVPADVGPALWVVPALGGLSGSAYQALAVEMSRAAGSSKGMALLDPPDVLVDPLVGSPDPDVSSLVGLAGILSAVLPAPRHTVMYSAPLLDRSTAGNEATGDPATGNLARVPASAVMAAQFTVVDEQVGPWLAPAGVSYPLTGYEPLFAIDNTTNATLNVAGIEAIRTMPGYGTVLWGARTLGQGQPTASYVSTVRTLDMIELAIRNGMRGFETSPNAQATWTQVKMDVSSFLDHLHNEGALFGSDDAEAYSVKVGVPESMTPADLAAKRLVVDVGVALELPAEFTQTAVAVTMDGG